MADDVVDAIRGTLFKLLLEVGLLRPVPVPLQVMEVLNGRAYKIVPLGIVWPSSCLYYASQDERLFRELLISLYERKAALDGGIAMQKAPQSPLTLPVMQDRGWVRLRDRVTTGVAWDDFQVVANGSR